MFKTLKRLEKIYENLCLLEKSDFFKKYIGYEETEYNHKVITQSRTFVFNTKYGKREILSGKHFLAYGEVGFWHYLEGYEKFGESYITCDNAFFIIEYLPEWSVFDLPKHPAEIQVKKTKDIGMSAIDIDLAILEVENILIKNCQKTKDIEAINRYFNV